MLESATNVLRESVQLAHADATFRQQEVHEVLELATASKSKASQERRSLQRSINGVYESIGELEERERALSKSHDEAVLRRQSMNEIAATSENRQEEEHFEQLVLIRQQKQDQLAADLEGVRLHLQGARNKLLNQKVLSIEMAREEKVATKDVSEAQSKLASLGETEEALNMYELMVAAGPYGVRSLVRLHPQMRSELVHMTDDLSPTNTSAPINLDDEDEAGDNSAAE